MELQKRVEDLEKQNRSLEKTVRVVVGVVVILGGYLGYQEAVRQFSQNRTLMSGDDSEFRLFATTDGEGRGLWALAPQAGAGVVSKNNTAGVYLYELDREGPNDTGPNDTGPDETGPAETRHSSIAFGTRAKLEANSTETLLALYDQDLKQRVRLHVGEDGPALVFYDEAGKAVYQVPPAEGADTEDP